MLYAHIIHAYAYVYTHTYTHFSFYYYIGTDVGGASVETLLSLLDGEINTTVDLVLARKGNGRMYAVRNSSMIFF